MRGDPARLDRGQLALLDAMVFFSIALLVSGAMVAYVQTLTDDSPGGACKPTLDASETLAVLLTASVARQMEVPLGSGLVLSGHESVAECLQAELYAISKGADVLAFREVNEAVEDLMKALSGDSFGARLLAVHPEGSSEDPVLAIPGLGGRPGLAYAASAELPCDDGVLYRVILILDPSASPELV